MATRRSRHTHKNRSPKSQNPKEENVVTATITRGKCKDEMMCGVVCPCVSVCVCGAGGRAKIRLNARAKKAAKLCVARTRHKEHNTTNRQRSSGADVCRRWRVGIDFLISCPHPPYLYLLTHQKKTTKYSSPPALLPPNDGGGLFLSRSNALTHTAHTHTDTQRRTAGDKW